MTDLVESIWNFEAKMCLEVQDRANAPFGFGNRKKVGVKPLKQTILLQGLG